MTAPARQAAFDILCRIELQQAHSDTALHAPGPSEMQPVDRNLATEICYGTLRWQGWLDYILQSAVSRPWTEVDPKVRIVLRMSVYQMARMDRIPDHAAINDAVELARQHTRVGATGFVNGVLRGLGRQRPWQHPDFHRDCPVWVRASLPEWLWHRWEARFGVERAFEYALSLNHPPRHAYRRCGAPGESAPGETISELVPGCFLPGDAPVPEEEMRHSQDEASQLIPFLLGPLGGGSVWDCCAAPGGKSLILMENCGLGGIVVSGELRVARAGELKRFLACCGRDTTHIVAADARMPAPFRELFDAVLADVPCSGTGTLRRNPEIKWRLRPERLAELAENQDRILESVSAAVRPGGKLLYSTCATEPEENEQVIERFLERHSEFSVARPTEPSGIGAWLDERGFFHSFPGPRLWDGFFAALLIRRG